MSIRIMAAVFDLPDMGPTHRLIMLALADHADDAGRCYPSLARLARRTGLTDRAIRTNLRQLEYAGQIRVEKQAGPKGCNVYFLTPQEAPTPEPRSPRNHVPPEYDDQDPGTTFPHTPEPRSPEPSYNHQETSLFGEASPAKTKRRKPSKQMPDDWTPDQATALRLRDQHNLTNDDLQFCYEQFRDDAHAKDKRFADWNRAFATWVRNSVNWGQVGPGSKRRGNSLNGSASGSAFY